MHRGFTALVCALVLLCGPAAISARENTKESTRIISLADLPSEARATLALIEKGGPFPYKQDGVVFNNFERRLPIKKRGYYREYTVRSPGARDRGARRIVAGLNGEFYYTDDHYRRFRRIRE